MRTIGGNMKRYFEKMKISRILVTFGIVAMIFEVLIGGISYLSLLKLDKNYQTIISYDDWSKQISDVDQSFKDMKNDILDLVYSKNYKNADDAEERLDSVNNFIDSSLQDEDNDENEKKLLQNLKTAFGVFDKSVREQVSIAMELKSQLESHRTEGMSEPEGGMPPEEGNMAEVEINFDSDSFEKITEAVDTAFNDLQDYITTYTEEELAEVEKAFNATKIFIISVILFSLIIFAAVIIGIVRTIKSASKEVIEVLHEVSNGNLNVEISEKGDNEFEVMKKELINTVNSFRNMIVSVIELSGNVNEKSENLSEISHNLVENTKNISLAIDEVTNGTTEQANDLVNINNTLEGFSETIEGFLNNVDLINGTSNEISKNANESNEKMDNLVKNFKYIGETFASLVDKINILDKNISKINEIIALIDSIAGQTNMLALNAAIEAARAGESGKGFAVVAEEVRKLAEQSMNSASEITDVIREISGDTKEIVTASDDVGGKINNSLAVIEDSMHSFEGIVTLIDEIVPKIEELAESSLSIGKEKEQIVSMIENASAIAEEVSASTEEISASIKEMDLLSEQIGSSSENLKDVTEDLQESISEFKL